MKKSLLIALFFALSAIVTFAQTPTTIPGKIAYQGKLLESGVPVTGTRTIEFSIPGTGWTETHSNVPIANGLYSVQLGSIIPFPTTVFSNPAVSLEIKVEGTTLSPQVELLSVPYAYKAENLGNVAHIGNSGNVGIGTTDPVSSAALEITSSTQGFLMPRMDSAQIVDITDPVGGLQVFNTTDEKVYIYVSAENTWKELSYGAGTIVVASPTVTDMDGNVYQTVQIGNQVWMIENLKTTRYNNGTAIPLVTDNTAWGNLTTGAYCWYNNSTVYENPYGKLYNWHAVSTGNLCPAGWHVPTDNEWKELEMFLGMPQTETDIQGWRGTDEGGKLKETGTAHWNSPNTGATNESGFTALPGGFRNFDGLFYYIGIYGHYWGASDFDTLQAWTRNMYYDYSDLSRLHYDKKFGLSVRCVKN